PVEVGSCVNNYLSRSSVKRGNYFYVASDWAGVRAFDVANPQEPNLVGFFDDVDDDISSVDANDRFVFAAGRTGFYICEINFPPLSQPGEDIIVPLSANLESWPNPFNNRSRVTVNLPSAGRYELALFDIKGEEAVKLMTGYYPTGLYQAELNAGGLPSGCYFLRLTGAATQTSRLVQLIR
ncbi:MAG: T9SS type A sorting domain-containing protein, partial [Calditrichota bacterium]